MTWTASRVEDIADVAIGPFGSAMRREDYKSSGLEVVSGGNLQGMRWPNLSDAPRISEETARRLSRSVVERGDLLFPHRGAIGRVGVADRTMMLSTSMMRARFRADVVDSEFAYWFFVAEGNRELLTMSSSVGTPGIGQPLASLRTVTVRFPSLQAQRSIAELLGALDDKITANRSVLDHSDELVRLTYRTLQASKSLTLGDLVLHHRQQVASEGIEGNALYLGLEHFDSKSLWLRRSGKGADVTSAKSAFRAGDTLFGKLRPYFHKVAIPASDGVCSTDILVLRPKRDEWRWVGASAASSDGVVGRAVQNSNGTKMPRANWTDIAGEPVPDPDAATSREFSSLVESLVKRCWAALRENERLAATRDELLPLLMSGRITVRDAEQRVEQEV